MDVGVLPSLHVVEIALAEVSSEVFSVDSTPDEDLEEQNGQHVQLSAHPEIVLIAIKITTRKATR